MGDNNEVDGRPDDVELFVTLKNSNQFLVNPDKLHIEFCVGKAVKMTLKDQDYVDYDIDKLRIKAKWSLLWKKDINLDSFKPGEERKIKIDKIHIYKLFTETNASEEIKPVGWRCYAVCGKSKIETLLYIEYTL